MPNKTCLKCGHIRQPDEGGDLRACPACGAYYDKVQAAAEQGSLNRSGASPSADRRRGRPAPQRSAAEILLALQNRVADLHQVANDIQTDLRDGAAGDRPAPGEIPPVWIAFAGALLMVFAVSLPVVGAGKLMSGALLIHSPWWSLGLLAAAAAGVWGVARGNALFPLGAGALGGVTAGYVLYKLFDAIAEMKAAEEEAQTGTWANAFSGLASAIAQPGLHVGWPLLVCASTLLAIAGWVLVTRSLTR